MLKVAKLYKENFLVENFLSNNVYNKQKQKVDVNFDLSQIFKETQLTNKPTKL